MGRNDDGRAEGDVEEVSPEQLRRQLTEIKGAMGLEERYPGQRRLWLVYGGGVAAVSIAMEALFTVRGLPGWAIPTIWVAFLMVAGVAQWGIASGTSDGSAPTAAPDWRILLGTLLAAFLSVAAYTEPLLHEASVTLSDVEFSRMSGAYLYSLVFSIAGVGFLFAGNALRAYRIRTRDRWVFYGAGIWMLAFAGLMTHFRFMRMFGYALGGVCFLLYSIAAYVLLGRADDT